MFGWGPADAAQVLRVPTSADHKYSRGVVLLETGSPTYPGAAALTVEGAWRAGVGMVRWTGDPDVARLVVQRRPETLVNAGERADAVVLGSGISGRDRDDDVTARFRGILHSDLPAVIDAGALDLVTDVRAPVVVTPHDAELADVRIPLGLGIDDLDGDPLERRLRAGFAERLLVVRETAVALGGAVLLKGADTIVATPGGWWTVVRTGTPWLATAGTGDVLAGALGALVAVASAGARRSGGALDVEALGPLAATAAWLHGTAARLAAGVEGGAPGRPITALDVADHLPAAFERAVARA
ncbi:hypothetical protein A7J15_04990 [Microbacterium sediminis]|uniref:ADP-dependent (S)-NAD(P)H-hydrate dehydratase n=2 Tax=Microbacterium sediminis TaxID=904291 RepID=A0A1B9NCA8_9MICO|nr:hypothetical protein A7J15_04990 [Microbacterium sediminis]QBR75355.1 NAD(P)H-hydrate dehydratase [Microbacterium sediminis]